MKTILRLGLSLVMAVAAMQVNAAVDGSYEGTYQEQAVNVVLETMSTTVTGMMSIGKANYLLQAENKASVYSGQLTNMANGETQVLHIKPSGDALDVRVNANGKKPMHFMLNRSK